MPSLFISAAHKSSGKTTVAIGLCAAFAQRGLRVQPFKKGPDYIDPMWLGQSAGRPCYNLDFYTMARDEIEAAYTRHMHTADLALIEGNKGLYDGLDLDGSNSNAALAKLLRSPVVLGGLAQMYVLIIGGQAYPMELFPGFEVQSSFADGVVAAYTPSLDEIALGQGGWRWHGLPWRQG